MGKVFENLTLDDLCDLMCGPPEEDGDENEDDPQRTESVQQRKEDRLS